MPRLKSMTTGSVPSFLDVILNIAESDTSSTLAFQDTWLAQLKARGDQLVMYGDDTWLKLFPGMFNRADGTTSFYVSVSDPSEGSRQSPTHLFVRVNLSLLTFYRTSWKWIKMLPVMFLTSLRKATGQL